MKPQGGVVLSRHARINELFQACVDQREEERAAFLARACGDDRELRTAVEAMLDFDGRRPDFLAASGAGPGAAAEQRLPSAIGPYRIRRKLGEGGMGAVYEAEQERPHRTVALKVLRAHSLSPQALRRFEHEGEFLARLQHPGIAQIFDSGRAEGEHGPQPYFAMELVRGEPVTEFARNRKLSARARLELVARIADAVQHAHQHGVIHRDLKPANILVDASGQPKVLDFGIARASGSDVRLTTLHTDVGQILGTLAYMSPEQAAGDSDAIDTRSDVYSLGVILFELLTEQLPYDVSKKLLPEAVRIIQQVEPRRLSTLQSIHRGDVETILSTALEKDRERRYASAAALAADIRHFLGDEPIAARPPSRMYTLRKFVRRNRTAVAATLAVFLALLLGLAASLRFGLREADQRSIAERASADAYRANMSLAWAHRDDDALVDRLLEASPELHRNWEWHHLRNQDFCELARVTLPLFEAAFLDEDRILTVDGECRASIWDPHTGEVVPVHPSEPTATPARVPLALSADGRWLLSHAPGSLFLGDPQVSGETVIPFPHTPLVPSLPGGALRLGSLAAAIAPDGSRLVVATDDDALFVVEPREDPRVERLRSYEGIGPIRSVSFSPDGASVAVVAERLLVLDPLRDEVRWTGERPAGLTVAFSPDGTRLAVWNGVFEFYDVASGGLVDTWDIKKRINIAGNLSFLDARYSPDGGFLAFSCTRGVLWLLDAKAQMRVASTSEHGSAVLFSPSGTSLFSYGKTNAQELPEGRLWSSGLLQTAAGSLRGHMSYVYAVALSPDGATIASGSWDETVRLWDAASGEEVAVLPERSRVLSLAFSPDGAQLASGSARGFVIRDAATGLVLAQPGSELTDALAYAPDGAWLAAAEGKRIHLRDARSWSVSRTLEASADALAVSPDGSLLATGSADAIVRLWDVRSGAPLAEAAGASGKHGFEGVHSLGFSPDGTRLVAAWGDSEVTLHAVPSLAKDQVLLDHRSEVFAVSFSPDGSRIASGGRDGQLRVWDASTGQLLVKLEGHDDYVHSLAFSSDGKRIVTGSGDTTVRIWDSEPAAERWRARRRARDGRAEAERLVARMYDELGDAAEVVARLEEDRGLEPDLRRLARQAVLRRQSYDAGTSVASVLGAGGIVSNRATLFTDEKRFAELTNARSLSMPAAGTYDDKDPPAGSIGIPDDAEPLVSVTGTGGVPVILEVKSGATSSIPTRPAIAVSGEDLLLLTFRPPVLAVGLELATNHLASERITIAFSDGTLERFDDSVLATDPDSIEFVGFRSTTPIRSIFLVPRGGAVRNEALCGIWLPDR